MMWAAAARVAVVMAALTEVSKAGRRAAVA